MITSCVAEEMMVSGMILTGMIDTYIYMILTGMIHTYIITVGTKLANYSPYMVSECFV